MPVTKSSFFKAYSTEEAAHFLLSGLKSNRNAAENVAKNPNSQHEGETESPVEEGVLLLTECIKDIDDILDNNQFHSTSKSPN